jgi:prophage regulatory protein
MRRLRLLPKKEVRARTSLAYATIDRMEKAGRFPTRQRLSDCPRGRVGWYEHEVEDWIRDPLGYRTPPKEEALRITQQLRLIYEAAD